VKDGEKSVDGEMYRTNQPVRKGRDWCIGTDVIDEKNKQRVKKRGETERGFGT